MLTHFLFSKVIRMSTHVFDFDCLKGANEDSRVIIKHNDKEMIIRALSTNQDGDVLVEVYEDFNEMLRGEKQC